MCVCVVVSVCVYVHKYTLVLSFMNLSSFGLIHMPHKLTIRGERKRIFFFFFLPCLHNQVAYLGSDPKKAEGQDLGGRKEENQYKDA